MRKYVIVLSLIVIGLASATLAGCGKKDGTAVKGNEAEIEKAAIAVAEGYAQGRYQLVDQEEMQNWVDLGEIMTVVDVRSAAAYAKGHIPGAVNAEIAAGKDSTNEQLQALIAVLPEKNDAIVVVYGQCTADDASHRGALYAVDTGYTNVYRLPGGAIGWQDADNKLTKK